MSLLVASVPPGHNPERETREAALERYASIAEDVGAITSDRREAAALVAIAVHESGLRVDVDEGLTRGSGLDTCLLQLRTARQDIATDRRACFREGLRRLRGSLSMCRSNPHLFALAAYASGSCSFGHSESRAMVAIWDRLSP